MRPQKLKPYRFLEFCLFSRNDCLENIFPSDCYTFSSILQVAEENGLEVEAAMAGAQVPTDSIAASNRERPAQADDALSQR